MCCKLRGSAHERSYPHPVGRRSLQERPARSNAVARVDAADGLPKWKALFGILECGGSTPLWITPPTIQSGVEPPHSRETPSQKVISKRLPMLRKVRRHGPG